ncbi:EmrB/QacA subfamily drug resistance transporter [Hamadaea flava]|uniref:MFS transporter n=1 Tax=Hamadaea flava TaxID=1742688 RepID=A0ABV8LI20_9ACTN|nr:MFS transporter [Hamadaea flava]MCP2325265.1 EmrB/QacA subfamily drug resistance transporter [Hamadaea flava]
MTATLTSPEVTSRGGSTPRGVMPVLLTATFMTALDFFIVNVALPAVQLDLRAGPAALQWVVAGYGLALAAGLITGGRLGDLYGRRRIFGLGLALFTVASMLCGLALSSGFLVGARVLQGLGAALMMPQTLAILRTAVPLWAQPKAFARYGLTLGLGAVFGQVIGGLLIKAGLFGLDWRMCFLINLPIGVAALVKLRTLPESRAVGGRLDLVGVLLVTAALVTLVLPLIQGPEQDWPLWTWLSLAGSAVLFGAFGVHQSRQAHPLVNPRLFRQPAFGKGLLAVQLFWMGQASFFLILALYLQFGRGLSALESGTVFMAIGAGYLLTSTNAHRFAARLGRHVLTVGALIMVAGLASMAVAAGHGIGWLLPGLAIDGIGMGLALAPLTTTVLAKVAPEHAGSASGVLSTVNQTGNAVGVALIGIVFYQAADYTGGFQAGLIALCVLELALAGLVQLLPRR